jgi:Subtilase family
MSGTSMAAPHISGMVALSQQLAQEVLGRPLSAKEFKDLLIRTGDVITDGDDEDDNVTNTNLQFRRANMLNLANEIVKLAPEVTLRIPVTVVGSHQKNGGNPDQDFDGNGPWMTFNTQAKVDNGKIKIDGKATWQEWDEAKQEKGDTIFSTSISEGFDIKKLLQEQYPQFANFEVNESAGIIGRNYENFSTIDSDLHDPQVIFQDNNHLVSKYSIVGDTKQYIIVVNQESPEISFDFHPVKVLQRNANGEIVPKSYTIPSSSIRLNFSYSGTGDLDFNGHGPEMKILTRVIPVDIGGKQFLRAQVSAVFRETEADFTTYGTYEIDSNSTDADLSSILVWKDIGADVEIDDGYLVDKVLSPQDTLKLTDVDIHSPQLIEKDNQSLVSSYYLVGDQDNDDLPGGNDMPSANLVFNVKLRLRPPV